MIVASKKYYWLRLKRDFFKRHDIRIIEELPNGKDYILFYLKLLCESVDHDGNLRFSEKIPYNEQMLATITNTNPDIVKSAVEIFSQLGMMEVMDDGTYYMTEVEKMIGSTSGDDKTRESTRMRVRACRERKKIESKRYSNVTVTDCNGYGNVTCNGEIEIEKELEKELEIDKEKRVDYQLIADMYNNTCVSFPRLTTLSDARKKAIKARLKTYTVKDFQTMFEIAEASSFLKGGNDRNWSATFDWMVKDSNMAKILDGNYNEKPKAKNRVADELDDFYKMATEWAEEG